jgi:L-ascorbate metabolism protein UlaG (beta-lactamase superfamily)
MSTHITFWGAAGFEIVWPGKRLLIDPFLVGNPEAPLDPDGVETPDLILVSHAAYDHVGDTAAIAKRTGAPVICGGDVRILLMDQGVDESQLQATVWGIVTKAGGIVVRPVECHHWSMSRLSSGETLTGVPLAFIVETEPGVRIYHYGDTAIFDMRLIGELYRPTVGLIGCTNPWELEEGVPGPGRYLTGEMSPDEAARAAEMLGVDLAVACHYIAWNEDVDRFVALVPDQDSTGRRQVLAPRVGDTIVVEDGTYRLDPPAKSPRGD